MKARVVLKYFVSYCLCKHFFDFNSPEATSDSICMTFEVTPRPFSSPKLKSERSSSKEISKTCLTR